LSQSVPGLDTLYISDSGKGFGQGGITKWTFDGTNWNETGIIDYSKTTQQLGFYWLAGSTSGSTVTLYNTYGNGGNAAFGPGFLYSVTDASGYGAAPTSATVTTLDKVAAGPVNGPYAGNETFRGVAFAPTGTAPSITSGTSTTFGVGVAANF